MMSEEACLDLALWEFRRLKELAEKAMAQIRGEDFFVSPAEADNSIAVLVKHMAGNMRSRWRDFLTSDGEKPDRMRDQEFVLTDGDTRQHLMSRWEDGWGLLFSALEPLGSDDLGRVVTIRGEPHSVLQATSRQVVHYAYHVGQIVYVARHFVGDGWESLSVPRGRSEAFNQQPDRYLDAT